MTKRPLQFLVAACLLLVTASGLAFAQGASRQLVFVDLVVMNKGFGLAERDKYDAVATPIAARYGIERIASFDIAQVLKGTDLEIVRFDLWHLPTAGALTKWDRDPDYVALKPFRDRIHDMRRLPLYFATPSMPLAVSGRPLYLVELQTFAAPFDAKLYGEHEKRAVAVAARHSVRRAGSYTLLKKINGDGPDAKRLIIWAFSDARHLKAWTDSREFKSLAALRRLLFDVGRSVAILAKAR